MSILDLESRYLVLITIFGYLSAAMLMHKYNAHGATSVGRYGLLGSAQDLAKRQKGHVSFVIHNLPVIAKLAAVSRVMQNQWRLTQGYSPEISGKMICNLSHIVIFGGIYLSVEFLSSYFISVFQEVF